MRERSTTLVPGDFRSLADSARNVYSQYGEDGIVDELFERIGTTNRYCVEIGAADGIFFSNTRRLLEAGWAGLLVEKDETAFRLLEENSRLFGKRVVTHRGEVGLHPTQECPDGRSGPRFQPNLAGLHPTQECPDEILTEYEVPTEPDLVCIDVDGQDFHIWNSMRKHFPRVMIVEAIAAGLETGARIPAIGGEGQAGAEHLNQLGASKGYQWVARTYSNMIFVRYDLAGKARDLLEPPELPELPIEEDDHNGSQSE